MKAFPNFAQTKSEFGSQVRKQGRCQNNHDAKWRKSKGDPVLYYDG